MSFLQKDDLTPIECINCGYKIVRPYPKDKICPSCKRNYLEKFKDETKKIKKKKKKKKGKTIEIEQAPQPKQFETVDKTVSSKLQGKVKVKKKTQSVSLESDQIELLKGEYIKLLGIVSVKRTPLFCSNEKYVYLLELTSNLDFIATSILGGVLDKMLLVTKDNKKEKCQFFLKHNIIYIVYGSFPDKKGKWILEQMAKHYYEMVMGKDVDQLDKFETYQIENKFNRIIKFILNEYVEMQEVFSDQEIPYVEDKIRIDYVGLSSKSIGVVSLLLGDELNVEAPGVYEDPAEALEMKESVLTAKIEAIAANTVGNTNAIPKWIAVKLGFQNYRFLTFKDYINDYFLYFLSEGNLGNIPKVEELIEPFLGHVIFSPFSGNLKPFNTLKLTLKDFFEKTREFS
ncbi:MAG: hypothetical protein ACFFC9_10475 [Promethearchaeota archaeon]